MIKKTGRDCGSEEGVKKKNDSRIRLQTKADDNSEVHDLWML